MSEAEYVCKSCGEDWEEIATAFYVEGKCANCGAPGGSNKAIKNKENVLLRDGSEDGDDDDD